jgi:S1-C subfamily serine protease
MRPNADFEAPWEYDRAGFDVELQDGVWKVSVVDAGSPAAAAGLKVGDQVVTGIDSVRRARFAPAGAQVAFNVLRGGERVRVPMTLADWL